jgi:MFS family permease
VVTPSRSGTQASAAGISSAAPAHGSDADKVRAAVRGGVLAYFVDQFDIYLPIVVLAPALGYFESSSVSAGTAALLSSLIFTATLVGRPLGALIFGHFADTIGRKRTTLVAVAGFGATTILIACLPGQPTIGGWSIGLLIALRFIDGVFLGGEYTTAVPLAMEWSPKRRRGFYSSVITMSSPGAYVVIAAITLLLLQVMPATGLHSAYLQWGWRIPFVVGALLAVVLFRYYKHVVQEPPAVRAGARHKVPILQLLASHPAALAQVFILMTGVWVATNMEAAAMPAQLATHLLLSSKEVTLTMLVTNAAAALSYPVFGVLSQRIGRRRFFIGYGIAVLVLGTGAYWLMMTSGHGFGAPLGYGVAVGVFSIGTFGPIAAYLTERFPSGVRSTGYGVGYSLALIAPAFYAFYLRQLSGVVAGYLAPAVLMAIAGVLISVGGLLGPETRDVDMNAGDVALGTGDVTA